MSKAINVIEEIEEIEEEVYEDWQYQESGLKASEFIETVLMPVLQEFDYGNEDENYIYGTATYGMFIELVPLLAQLGYTKEDLYEQLSQYMDFVNDRTLH
jgi:hypothetical protein